MPGRNPAKTDNDNDIGFALGVDQSTVSQCRRPVTDLGKFIQRPAVPRANKAVSKEMPEGTPFHAERFKDYVSVHRFFFFLKTRLVVNPLSLPM